MGRVLFTDESRFSLSSDSHRILIWREREAAIIPRTSLKGTEALWGPAVPFHGRQCTMSSHSSCRTALREMRILNVWIGRHDLPDLNPIEHVWDFLGRRLAARTLPPVTIRSFDWRCKTNGQQCLNNSLTPSFSAWAERCETRLAVRGDHIPPTKAPDASCWTPITGMFRPSVALALHA
ncbi:hypothetical protein TNCV_4059011, partial [Trichonephila clavipes]